MIIHASLSPAFPGKEYLGQDCLLDIGVEGEGQWAEGTAQLNLFADLCQTKLYNGQLFRPRLQAG